MKQGCKLWGGEKRERVLIIHVGERFWEEIWRYYILLFGDIGSVGTMEYGKYVASGEECDHV